MAETKLEKERPTLEAEATRGLTAIAGVAVTRDAFLGGALRLYQPERGYRAGTDAVLLAASLSLADEAAVRAKDVRVADLGAGVGTVGLCLATRLTDVTVDLVEREPDLSEIGRHNILANGFADRVRPLALDILDRSSARDLATDAYDHVVANPPFYRAAEARAPTDALKAASHVFGANDLDGWVRCMARITKPGGCARLIYPAENLGDLLQAFNGRFGDIAVMPLYPRRGQTAIRVIVTGRKGSRGPMVMLPPVMLHNEGSPFRPEISAVLNAPNALEIKSASKPTSNRR